MLQRSALHTKQLNNASAHSVFTCMEQTQSTHPVWQRNKRQLIH